MKRLLLPIIVALALGWAAPARAQQYLQLGTILNCSGGQVPVNGGGGVDDWSCGTTAGTGTVTTTATLTTGTIPKASGGAALHDSIMAESGSTLTVTGTLNATTALQVNGGAIPVGNGGTGLTSVTANELLYGNGTGALQKSSSLTFDGATLTSATVSTGTPAYVWGTRVSTFGNAITAYDANTAVIGVPGATSTQLLSLATSAGASIAEFYGDKTVKLYGTNQFTAGAAPSSGASLAIYYAGGEGKLRAYTNWATAAGATLRYDGGNHYWDINGVNEMNLSGAGVLTLVGLAAPVGHSYYVCVNSSGQIASQAAACAG